MKWTSSSRNSNESTELINYSTGKMENHFFPTRKKPPHLCLEIYSTDFQAPSLWRFHISMVSFPPPTDVDPRSQPNHHSQWTSHGKLRWTQTSSEKVVDSNMFLNMFNPISGEMDPIWLIFFENVDLYFSKSGWNHHLGRKAAFFGSHSPSTSMDFLGKKTDEIVIEGFEGSCNLLMRN